MTGAVLHIDASDLGRVGKRLDRLLRRVSDATPLMDDIGAMLVTSTQDRFERGVDPEGTAWKQSDRVTRAQGNAQTLVDTGRLMTSITHVPGNNEVEVGTNVIYGAIHQAGGQAGRGKSVTIPARPYLGISFDDRAEIGNLIDDYLMEALQ